MEEEEEEEEDLFKAEEAYWPDTGTNIRRATPARRRGGMNTLSENGNDFVGRLLHEGGVWRRTFLGFSQY